MRVDGPSCGRRDTRAIVSVSSGRLSEPLTQRHSFAGADSSSLNQNTRPRVVRSQNDPGHITVRLGGGGEIRGFGEGVQDDADGGLAVAAAAADGEDLAGHRVGEGEQADAFG